MFIGGSQSSNRSRSSASSESYGIDYSQSNQQLSQQQLAMQQQLYGQMQPMMNRGPAAVAPGYNFHNQQAMQGTRQLANQAQRYGQQSMGRGTNAYQQMRGQAAQASNAAWGARHQGQQGLRSLGQYSQGNNPYLAQQIQGLGADIGRQFREQILPGIGSSAQMAGQRGGSRQSIGEGMAAGRAMEEFQQGATTLRSNAYGQGMQAAGQQAALGTQAGLGYTGLSGDLYGQMAQQQYGMAQNYMGQALGARGQQGALANQYARTGMMPFQIGASVVGSPSVLGSSMGYGMDYSQSEAESYSRGGSQGLNIGFGGK